MTSLSFEQALGFAKEAAVNSGASEDHAEALARSIVTAEAEGNGGSPEGHVGLVLGKAVVSRHVLLHDKKLRLSSIFNKHIILDYLL